MTTIRNPFALYRTLASSAHITVCPHCRSYYDLTRGCQCAKARALRIAPVLAADELLWCDVD